MKYILSLVHKFFLAIALIAISDGAWAQLYSGTEILCGDEKHLLGYDYVGCQSEGLFLAKKDGKAGFIDEAGKVVIELQYDDAVFFVEGLAKVKKDNQWGFIDKTGKLIIPLHYKDVNSFSEGLAKVKKDAKLGFIDKTGKVIVPL